MLIQGDVEQLTLVPDDPDAAALQCHGQRQTAVSVFLLMYLSRQEVVRTDPLKLLESKQASIEKTPSHCQAKLDSVKSE